MTIKRRLARLFALVRVNRLERELSDEVRAHLELAEHDAIARGLDPADARRDALRQFGGIEQMKEAHRDDRSVRWIENLIKDVRYGLASLRREPVFAIVAIAVLALGIGANTAVFSIVDAVLLKPLPFPNPERIVRMWESTPTGVNSTTALNFVELRRRLHTFDAFSAEVDVNATAEIGGEPVRLQGRRVSANHFDVFGVAPMLGRTFAPEEDQPGAANVLIISHAAWQQRFGGDPRILERDVRLDGIPFRIIGVMPPGALDRDRRRPRDGLREFLEAAGPDHGTARGRFAFPESGRAIETRRLDRRRAARHARGPRGNRGSDPAVEEGLERQGRTVRRSADRRHVASIALCRAWRCRAGAADRLRQPHEPAARSRCGTPEGDRVAIRPRREPRPADRAVVDGEPGARPVGRPGWRRPRLRVDARGDPAAAGGDSLHGDDRTGRASPGVRDNGRTRGVGCRWPAAGASTLVGLSRGSAQPQLARILRAARWHPPRDRRRRGRGIDRLDLRIGPAVQEPDAIAAGRHRRARAKCRDRVGRTSGATNTRRQTMRSLSTRD